jgi:hypothetical protein
MTTHGGCLCGAVEYQITGSCSNMLNCHCGLCRKSHGSLFATFTSVPKDKLVFTCGEEQIRHYSVSPHLARSWCGICGTTLPFLEGLNYSVPAGTLKDNIQATIVGHIFTASKVPWYDITDDLRQYETFPNSMSRPAVSAQPDEPQSCDGSCLCRTCRFDLVGEPTMMMNCHCNRCRQSRSAAHATNVFYPAEALQWISGEQSIQQFKLPGADRFGSAFCIECGSLLPRIHGDRCNIPVGCLNIDPGIRPKGHIFTDSKANWFEITDDKPQFPATR